MEALKIILTIVYVLICIALVVVVMAQEGKEGLSSAIMGGGSGGSDTYWSKNKGRSKEGKLSKATVILATLFIVISIVLNLSVMQ